MQRNIKHNLIFKTLIFLLISVVVLVSVMINGNIYIFAAESEYKVSIDKIHSQVNVNDDFDGSSVIVVLDRRISEINKRHDTSLFGDIDFCKIEDLSFVTDESTIADVSNFEQILQIKLPNDCKETVLKVIEQLSKIDGVKYAGPNRIFKVERIPNDPFYTHPTNPEFGQWGLNTVQSGEAWNFITGNNNVRVGIIDTGIANHPDLNANVGNGGDFVNMTDTLTPGPLRNDPDGHGTHVAGIVGAEGNQTTPTGVAGVNWNVTLVPMQVANNAGEIEAAACVRAVNFARDTWNTTNRISILSMSIGGTAVWPEMETAIRVYPGLFVCSTGNRDQDNNVTRHYPSFYGSELHTNPLTNMISVGRSDINDSRPADANYGADTITLYAPGQEILSTYPEAFCTANPGVIRTTRWGNFLNCECIWTNIYHSRGIWEWVPNGTTHHADGYHRMSGSSMATPFVSGVAALLLSIDSNLTTNQLRTAIINSVDIPNVNGANPLEGLCVTNGRLNAYNAVKFVLKNYSNTTYTLSNYSGSVNSNKTIVSGDSYFNEKNGFYKLNVTYAKSYEFISSSNKALNVALYDKDFNEVIVNDLDTNSFNIHIIKDLSVGTYYLKVAYTDNDDSGTINTKIVSRNTQYLLYNQDNDILINYYNDINTYYYVNGSGAGMYKITLTATKADGTTVTYPNEAIIVKDQMNASQEYKYDVLGYSKLAENDSGINNFYMYLPRNGYFYIHINMPDAQYSNLKLSITSADSETIEMLNRMTSTFTEKLFDEAVFGDYAKAITINQTGNFKIDFSTIDDINGDITLVLIKKEYNSTTGNYYKIDKYAQYLNNTNKTRSVTRTLDPGTYYIGYFNNLSGANIIVTLTRVLQNNPNMTTAMVADPGLDFNYGSEVRFNNGQFGNHSITEGFTRNLYFIPESGTLPSLSRLDYDWYSSNPNIATVSQFGTVFAKDVTSNTPVTIYAVYKVDASLIYSRTFNVLKDTSEEIIEIECNMIFSYLVENGTYQIELNESNCPYPWIQYYTWTVFVPCQENDILVRIDQWGEITSTGPGYAVLTGQYYINPRVYVKINLTITE